MIDGKVKSRTLLGHEFNDFMPDANKIAISSDGNSVVSFDGLQIRVWNLSRQDDSPFATQFAFIGYCCSLHPDHGLAIIASFDEKIPEIKTIKVWNLNDLQAEPLTLPRHNSSVTVEEVTLSSNGRLALALARDGILEVWDLANPKGSPMTMTIESDLDQIQGSSLLANGYLAVYASHDRLTIWDIQKRECLATYPIIGFCPAVSEDYRTIVSADKTGYIHFLHLEGLD